MYKELLERRLAERSKLPRPTTRDKHQFRHTYESPTSSVIYFFLWVIYFNCYIFLPMSHPLQLVTNLEGIALNHYAIRPKRHKNWPKGNSLFYYIRVPTLATHHVCQARHTTVTYFFLWVIYSNCCEEHMIGSHDSVEYKLYWLQD